MTVLSRAQVATLAKRSKFPNVLIPLVVGIATAESGRNPDAVNHSNADGSSDYGLMQINSTHSDLLSTHNWRDPQQNMDMAYSIYRSAGNSFHPWTTFVNGSAQRDTKPVKPGGPPIPATSGNGSSATVQPVGITSDLASIGGFLSKLSDPELWKRVGYGAAGVAIIIVGLVAIDHKQVTSAVKTAGKVAALA